MGFINSFTGDIPDSSALNLATTGLVFMGLTDWAVKDSNQRLNNTIILTGLSYNIQNHAN